MRCATLDCEDDCLSAREAKGGEVRARDGDGNTHFENYHMLNLAGCREPLVRKPPTSTWR